MPTSEARILANRQNSSKSTGPKEGKERSRRNGLKHGLTGSGVVLSAEDAPEVDRRAAALLAEIDPKSTLGKVLVGQLASLSVKMERGARREDEAIASRVRHAAEDFDHGRVDRAEGLLKSLADDPRGNLRLLRRSPEGVDRLVEAWGELRGVLTRTGAISWDASHQATAAHLSGQRPEQVRGTRFDRLAMALRSKIFLDDPEWTALDDKGRRGWARDRMVDLIDAEIAGLQAHRETLDLEAIALDRLGAADMALFDPSREASLARRYETEARRKFFQMLKELRQAEAEAAEYPAPRPVSQPEPEQAPAPEPKSEPEPAPASAALASSCAGASTAPHEPRPRSSRPIEWAPDHRDGAARGLDGRVLTIGRAMVGAR